MIVGTLRQGIGGAGSVMWGLGTGLARKEAGTQQESLVWHLDFQRWNVLRINA